MADVELTYKGSTIGSLSDSGSLTLETAGKYCEADIVVQYTSPGGGGTDYMEENISDTLTSYFNSNVTSIRAYAFAGATALQSVDFPHVTTLKNSAFLNCSGLTSASFPVLATLNGTSHFQGTMLSALVLPQIVSALSAAFLQGQGNIAVLDLGPNATGFGSTCLYNTSSLNTIILRKSSAICTMGGSPTQTFGTTSPFASGKAGGTIYIPKALYDHLGDGSSLDYKAATNWSTVDGYGTITWAQIEGSQYENYYADGTPIS